VGWDETYQQYFDGTGPIKGRNVSKILTNVVTGLKRNATRKFTYCEQAFFAKWYETQTPDEQADVKALVASGQLVFINGGWSMHDEAGPTYTDMLDNTHVGQRFIAENFGVSALPTLTWQIDPFGHSAFQGVMSSKLAGYEGVMWAREDGAFRDASRAAQKCERVWLPSPSQPGVAAFQGTFTTHGYGSPQGRCDGGSPTDGSGCGAQWAAIDAVALAVDVLYDYALSVRDTNVLVLWGTDFTTENAVIEGGPDTEGYFAYVEALAAALNSDPAQRFNAFLSTPAAYVAAKLDAVAALPAYITDFFPYADDDAGHNQWTGYLTSRPAFKGFKRTSSAWHQTARQLQLMAGSVADLGPSNSLFKLERAMGVTEHHDGVSGTSKQVVVFDYASILEGGLADARAGAAADAAAVTGYAGAPFAPCPLANVSLCPALEAGAPAVALLFNDLAQPAAAAPVRLAAGFPPGVASYTVFDAAGAAVTAQLVPLTARDAALRALNGGSAAPVQWLCFTAALPAAGFAAYFLVPSAAAVPTTAASVVAPAAGDVVVSNGRLSLTVPASTGWPAFFADNSTGVALPLAQSWAWYEGFDGKTNLNGSNQASGAYIFRPATQTASPAAPGAAAVTLVTGPVVNMTFHEYGYVTQETRLWAGAASVEAEWTVGPVDVSDGKSHEVITRWSSGLATNATWATDSNCREAQVRKRNWRANYTIAVSGEASTVRVCEGVCVRVFSATFTAARPSARRARVVQLLPHQLPHPHGVVIRDAGRGRGPLRGGVVARRRRAGAARAPAPAFRRQARRGRGAERARAGWQRPDHPRPPLGAGRAQRRRARRVQGTAAAGAGAADHGGAVCGPGRRDARRVDRRAQRDRLRALAPAAGQPAPRHAARALAHHGAAAAGAPL